jgi:hypothetical protein
MAQSSFKIGIVAIPQHDVLSPRFKWNQKKQAVFSAFQLLDPVFSTFFQIFQISYIFDHGFYNMSSFFIVVRSKKLN